MNLHDTPHTPAYEHNGQPVSRAAFYAVACNPQRSVAVEACAGAGKTWMLVSRIVRALLAGAQPQEILAITFTRKAAGEMRTRLDEWLTAFAQASPEQLHAELTMRGVPPHIATEQQAALGTLYQTVLAVGRPVQIRTFHSWFAALLRTAPLSVLQALGLPAHYNLLEDDAEAVRQVWRRFHDAVVADPQARADFGALVAEHGRWQTAKALTAALNKRIEFTLADDAGVVAASVPPFTDLPGSPPEWAALSSPEQALDGEAVRSRWLAWAQALGVETNKTPQKAAEGIVSAFEQVNLHQRLDILRKALFVASDDRLNKNLQKFPAAQDAEAELQRLCAARRQHSAWLYQHRMARLTRLLIVEFSALKRENGWVDMNDVERAAQVMLSSGVLSGWVQEKLDARIRHLLIDEFQDTNPLQWQSLHAWLSGYVGSGGGQGAPSVFIVGDPKQSIYRFRRAEPQVFRAAQTFVREGLGGDLLSCDHTRRNALGVIEVTNSVMSTARDAGEYPVFRTHTTESTEPGAVLALPQISRDDAADGDAGERDPLAWRDSLTTPRILPEETLRTRECRQAAHWLAGRIAAGVHPREIMVLSRRRERLGVMEEELRQRHIATQQPEKADLADAPEVQDLIALLDVLVSPAHDLSLARVLKSPLFGATDADLVALALLRRQPQHTGRSWYELLQLSPADLLGEPPEIPESPTAEAADTAPADAPADPLPAVLRAAGLTLTRYKVWVDTLPPHDALHTIYHDADVLARFAAAAPVPLRGVVLANLRALLSAAMGLEGGRYLTPYALVRAFKQGGIRAPVTADADAVRLLTIHGAKGLEAELVLMLDTDGSPPKTETMGLLVDWPGESQVPVKLIFLASEANPPPCAIDTLTADQTERSREELNALYVAMTRAKDTLVISSVQPARAVTGSAWQRIEPLAQAAPFALPADLFADTDADTAHAIPADDALPPFFLPDLPYAPVLSAPPAPAARDANSDEGEGDETSAVPVEQASLESRIGQAMHWLLETWQAQTAHAAGPEMASTADAGFEPQRLQQAARRFELNAEHVAQAATRARCILQGAGAWAWDSALLDWHSNEVELTYNNRSLRMDRLVRRIAPPALAGWWVLDYKSAATPESQPALVAQLRKYRSALQAAYPGEPIYAAFLSGDGGQIMVDELL